MHTIPIIQVDAFTQTPFRGNPAAVSILDSWLPDETLQNIALENNLSETAFLVPQNTAQGLWHLRWFTPTLEIDLCGHATLASAHTLFTHHDATPPNNTLTFSTKSGPLTVQKLPSNALRMNFPARPAQPIPNPHPDLIPGLQTPPEAVYGSVKYLAVYPSETHVRNLAPNMQRIANVDRFGVIATAPADDPNIDFVSRYFAPAAGVPEDPVTGSAHCTLTPYWSQRLNKPTLRARQISKRTGDLLCTLRGDRVLIEGHCVTTLQGHMTFP